jgi:predicted nucleotidyltransferase
MSVSTKSDLLHLLFDQQQQIRAFGVTRLGLFGSFVREQPHTESDIDILVEFEVGRKTFDNFINLSFYLEELFGRKVDLLTPESLSPHIGPHILRQVEYVPFST